MIRFHAAAARDSVAQSKSEGRSEMACYVMLEFAAKQGNESRLTTHRAEDFEQVLRIV